MIDLNYILPELFISISLMFILLIGVFKKKSSLLVYNLTMISLFILIILLINLRSLPSNSFFGSSYLIDELSNYMKIITVASGIFVLLTSLKYIKSINIFKIEYPVLILSSMLGMMVMISSNDLIVFYMGLELQSLALYVLASFNRENLLSSESGLKYFVLSALSSGILLYGCSLVYGFSGSTNYSLIAQNILHTDYRFTIGIVFILVGLAFKISAVPFHMWAPDVYEGSPTSVTVFFAILPKIAAITVFIRFLYVPFVNMIEQWQMIIIFLSIASMILGAIAAIGQNNLKRLVAYSSIGHMGYALAGISTGTNEGIQSSIIYIFIYLVMNLAFFSCLFMLRRDNKYFEKIEDLSGISKNHPILALSLLLTLFSLAGIPPLAGFFAKFYIFLAVIEKQMYFLAIIGLISSVVAAFYYLRIIKIMYFDKEKDKYDTDHHFGLKASLIITTIFILLYFIHPSPLIEIINKINLI